MESFIKDQWKAIKGISKILKDKDISFTFIGGAARNQYNYLKTTQDIDILIAKKDIEKIKNLPIGFIKKARSTTIRNWVMHQPKTEIEFIFEGDISGDGVKGLKFVSPKSLSNNIKGEPFITLENLIKYKLSSGLYGHLRFKDFDDSRVD